MSLECDVVRDLLPLYAEDMVSVRTHALMEEHLADCAPCREMLTQMNGQEPNVRFRVDAAQQLAHYEKKKKRSFGWKVALITAGTVAAVFLIRIAAIGGLTAFLFLDGISAKVEEDTDPAHYAQYMGETAQEQYRQKWGMDETIFPAELTEDMDVREYKMVYYNPWDAQYLSYLTVAYSPEDYAQERERLAQCGSTAYQGYYGVTGFSENTELMAMYADDYHGFVYAISTPGQEETITYVEIIFCNYYMDLDYEKYIPAAYFPEGFDASDHNAYRKEKLADH